MKATDKQALLHLSVLLVCLTSPVTASAQSVFVSPQSATLPTAAAARGGDIRIEISHRLGYLSDGPGG